MVTFPRDVFKWLTSKERYETIGVSKWFDELVLSVSMELYPSEHWYPSKEPAVMIHIFGDYHLSRRHSWLCMHGAGAFENACVAGDADVIRMILPYAVDDDVRAGFDAVCSYGYVDLVNMLAADARVNVHEGLWLACERGHGDVIKRILELKPGYLLSDSSRDASILKACMRGDVEILRFLLASTSRVPADVYGIGLSSACERKNTAMVEYLLGLRLVNASDMRKALSSAGSTGDITFIERMIKLMKLDRLPAIGGALERGYFHVYLHFAKIASISHYEHEILLCGACAVGAVDSVKFIVGMCSGLDINDGLVFANKIAGKSKRTKTVKYLRSIGATLPWERRAKSNTNTNTTIAKPLLICECNMCWRGDDVD